MAESKTGWDKFEILIGLLTPAIVAILGILGSMYLNKQEEIDRASLKLDINSRLYTELMSTREQADSNLRRGMFETIIDTFLSPGEDSEQSAEKTVLAVEMLAYNFHDVIDIAPLFQHVADQISESTDAEEKARLHSRLVAVARDAVNNQAVTLSEQVEMQTIKFRFGKLTDNKPGWIRLPAPIRRRGQSTSERISASKKDRLPTRRFLLQPLNVDDDAQRINLRLTVRGFPPEDPPLPAEVDENVSVGFFDFPMINNIRLPGGARCAVVLLKWTRADSARVGLLYFPGSRSSLKDRQYYDEVLAELSRTVESSGNEND